MGARWVGRCCVVLFSLRGAPSNAKRSSPQRGIPFALCKGRRWSADLPTGGVRGSGRVGVGPNERAPGGPDKRISPLTTFPKIQVSRHPPNVKSPTPRSASSRRPVIQRALSAWALESCCATSGIDWRDSTMEYETGAVFKRGCLKMTSSTKEGWRLGLEVGFGRLERKAHS